MIPPDEQRQVETRAAGRCEYCRMHQSLQGASFHIEHVIPRSHGGPTVISNLAWACPSCNLHKSDRTHAFDPDTQAFAELFHPRIHSWSQHFAWDDFQIIERTPIGRATVVALNLNHPRRILIRQAEQMFALFPPSDHA